MRMLVVVVALFACSVPDKEPSVPDDETPSPGTTAGFDARVSSNPDAPEPDAPPPPSVDAGPAPVVECKGNGDKDQCELPPSSCLDLWYALVYTSASCVAGQCRYERELRFCDSGCTNGGC